MLGDTLRGSEKGGPDGEINSPLHGSNAARLRRRPLPIGVDANVADCFGERVDG